MKCKGKRLFSLVIALSLAVSIPFSWIIAKTEKSDNNRVSSISEDTKAPALPEGFSGPLEDNDGLTLADGADAKEVYGCDTAVDITSQWASGTGHATIKDPDLFKKTAFTVLFDVRQDAPTGDTNVTDRRVACTIGNESNSLRLLNYEGTLGYGGDSSTAGVAANQVPLTGVDKGGWNALAMIYQETGSGSHVIVYINGEKAGEVKNIGFKLSVMDDLTVMLARTFKTNYLQQGRYDNLVVGDTILDEETAIAVTAYRKQAKDALASNIYNVRIKGSDVDKAAAKKNGLTYKGFGMLNGNSTSNLLLDYKVKNEDAYWKMMEYLFGGDYPLFTHIKMEMGNDGNNSTGAESCTMRYENEEADASRSPGFVMAADAKKINPNVKISILRWEMPDWVSEKWSGNKNNDGYKAMYKWYRETIFDAYEKYGYVVDFISPDKNETTNPDAAFIKWLSNQVKTETDFPDYMDQKAKDAYNNIRIIASDEYKGLQIVPKMRNDKDLYEAVDIIGFHYRTNATDDYVKMADEDNKEVWYSEGCAAFGYTELQENKTCTYGSGSIGGYQSPLALMDSFITAFDSSRRTHYVFQPAIGSFYEGIQYGHKELLSARDPWSGYIHYDPALYMLGHFAKFAKTGWEDSEPDTDDIWLAISSATSPSFPGSDNEHATAGINGNAGFMTLVSPDKKDFSVVMVNNTQNEQIFSISTEEVGAADSSLKLWLTETDNYMQKKGIIKKTEEGWSVSIPAYSIATATTLDTVPERTPVDEIHNDDRHVLDTDKTGGKNGVTSDDVLYADNFEYKEEAKDFLSSRGNEPRYMLDTHGAWIVENGELKQELAADVAQWNSGEPSTVVGDFRWMDYAASVDIRIPDGSDSTWARLTVRSQTGMNWNDSGYTLSINGTGDWELYRIGTKVAGGSADVAEDHIYKVTILASHDVISVAINNKSVTSYRDSVPMRSGRVKLSSTWDQVYFDNLLVNNVAGGVPYALSMMDGQDDSVTYEGSWSIVNPGGGNADNWYRTVSTTSDKNSSFTFPINGAGFSILGSNNGTAKLDIYVDDNLESENAVTLASPVRGETYSMTGLDPGRHTIKVIVKSGTLNIDALYALGAALDVEGDILTYVKTDDLPKIPAVTSGSAVHSLPEQVEVYTASGTTVTKNILWDTSTAKFEGKDFEQVYITGTVQDGVDVLGHPLVVSLPIGMYVPSGTVYFIDSVDTDFSKNATTKPYEVVKGLIGNRLLNQVYDQYKSSGNTWGLLDMDAKAKGYNGDTSDKIATGLYGKENVKGETLSYVMTLPAGKYRIISGHREWWNMSRPMTASLKINNTTQDAGNINLNNSSGDLINAAEFTLDYDQPVTYTLTSAGTQAPVISWLAVVYLHSYVYQDNGNGTHTGTCKDGDGDQYTEKHNYQDGSCILCGSRQSIVSQKPDSAQPGISKPDPSRVVPSRPAIFHMINSKKGISIKWKKAVNATSYQVYRKKGKGKWRLVKTTSKISLTDTKANRNGARYQYRIYALRGNIRSQVSDIRTIYRLTAQKIKSVKNVKVRKLSLKWVKNAKAKGYVVQCSTTKKFSKTKTITKTVRNSKKNAKTFSKLRKGKKYSIRIRSYKGSGKTKSYSAWSKVKTIKIYK